MSCVQCISFAPMLTMTVLTPRMVSSLASCDATSVPLIASGPNNPCSIDALVQARLTTVLLFTPAMSAA